MFRYIGEKFSLLLKRDLERSEPSRSIGERGENPVVDAEIRRAHMGRLNRAGQREAPDGERYQDWQQVAP